MGALLLTGPNQSHDLALKVLLKAAEANSPDAMNLYGQMKELGLGANEDQNNQTNMAEALKWYEKAVSSGHPAAIFNMGSLYETGNGVEINLTKAVALYTEVFNI